MLSSEPAVVLRKVAQAHQQDIADGRDNDVSIYIDILNISLTDWKSQTAAAVGANTGDFIHRAEASGSSHHAPEVSLCDKFISFYV